MRKNIRRILSIVLILSLLIPSLVFADNNILIDYSQSESNALISVYGPKNQEVSITVKDDARYYYIDQGILDESGKIDFQVALEAEKTYACQVNINGTIATKKIVMSEGEIDPNPELPKDAKVSLYIRGYKGVILDEKGIRLDKNDNLLSLTRRILDDYNIDYLEGNGYIVSIDNQNEFDRGKDSGWMFSINGEYPSIGAGLVRLEDGDSIRWLYTDNLGKDIGAPVYEEEVNSDISNAIKEALSILMNKDSSDKEIIKALDNIADKLEEVLGEVKTSNIKTIFEEISKVSELLLIASNINDNEELSVKVADTAVKASSLLNDLVIDKSDKDIIEDLSKISAQNMGIVLNSIKAIKDNSKIDKIIKDIIDISIKVEDKFATINSSIDKNIEKSIRIELIESNKDIGEITLPQSLVEESVNKKVETIRLSFIGSLIEIETNNLHKEIEDDIKIRLEADNEFTLISFEENNKILEELQKPIRVTIPYDSNINNSHNIRVLLLMEDGGREIIGGLYNESTKTISFLTHKLGKFVVEENKVEFKDLSNHSWAIESISAMAAKGIINGKTASEFYPGDNITRAEFSALISRILKYKEGLSGEMPFNDVSNDKWYYESILTAYGNGLVNGKSSTEFDPEGYITREEISKIMGGILLKEKYREQDTIILEKFTDLDDVALWAREEASIAVYHEIIKGDSGRFNPKENASRAETAAMLYRLYGLILN